MVDVAYRIVEHDGGWAYKLGDVFSETFSTRAQAEAAATRVADEQRVPGETEAIEWQDEDGRWHEETEDGSDRPNAYVEDAPRAVAAKHATTRSGSPNLVASLLLAGLTGVLIGLAAKRSRRR